MQVQTKFFPQVMPDNELAYLAHLQGIIDSVDEQNMLVHYPALREERTFCVVALAECE